MKKLFMTLIAAASMLAIGCTKDENAVTDEEAKAKLVGVWKLAEIKFDDEVIHPENYANYVREEYQEEYQEFVNHYNNDVILTFYTNDTVEVYGQLFGYQIRENNVIAFSGEDIEIEGMSLEGLELRCNILSLTDEEAQFEGLIPGFVIPMPRFFRFPGGTASCRLTRVSGLPE